MIDVALIYLAWFGVWPFANPDHSFGTVTGALDIGLHAVALVALGCRWRIVRRFP